MVETGLKLNATLFWKMIPLSIHLPVCPFIQNEHAFKLGLWYIIQSTGYVIKWLTTYSNDFFCIMMKFSFSRVLTWMYLTDAIFLKSSDVWCYWVLLWFSYCSIFCFVLQRRYGHSTFLPASMSLRNAPLWMKIPLTSLRYENLGFTSQ